MQEGGGTSHCLNKEPCCGIRTRRGECYSNPIYMKEYCMRSCGFCASSDRTDGKFAVIQKFKKRGMKSG